jgi:ferredoxin-like protein FixX
MQYTRKQKMSRELEIMVIVENAYRNNLIHTTYILVDETIDILKLEKLLLLKCCPLGISLFIKQKSHFTQTFTTECNNCIIIVGVDAVSNKIIRNNSFGNRIIIV